MTSNVCPERKYFRRMARALSEVEVFIHHCRLELGGWIFVDSASDEGFRVANEMDHGRVSMAAAAAFVCTSVALLPGTPL